MGQWLPENLGRDELPMGLWELFGVMGIYLGGEYRVYTFTGSHTVH